MLLATFSLTAGAQNWCPPGAMWTYGLDAFGSYGYEQYTYAGDTSLGGLPGQRIDLLVGMSSFFNEQQDFNHYPASLITGLHGDVVSQWSDAYQGWDTLFWLGAVPGDVFSRPFASTDDCDPLDHFMISDTTSVSIDGLLLRKWTVTRRWAGTEYGALHFTERIGWEWSMLPYPVCMAVDGPAGLRCYSDQEINASFFSFGCTTLVGINETRIDAPLEVFPNPGTDHFSLTLPPGMHAIEVFDATGRKVLEQRTGVERPLIDTRTLPPGLFLVQSADANGLYGVQRWVKE